MKRSKKGNIFTGILISLLLLVIAGRLAYRYVKHDLSSGHSKIKPMLEAKAKKAIRKATDSLYRVTYSRLDVNPDSGHALIQHLRISPDTAIYQKLIREGKAPNGLFTFTAREVIMDHFGFKDGGDDGAFHIGKIIVSQPQFKIVGHQYPQQHPDKEEEPDRLGQIIRFLFNKLDIDRMNLVQVDAIAMKQFGLVYTNENGKHPRTTTLHDLDLSINNFSSGSFAQKDTADKEHAAMKIAQLRLVTSDKLYDLVMKNMQLMPEPGKITIATTELIPRVSLPDFPKVLEQARNTRYRFRYSNIALDHIDFRQLAKTGTFHIGQLNIGDAWFDAYTDYNWQLLPPPARRNAYPQELLQQLAFDVTIDRMNVGRADVYYRLVGEKSKEQAVYALKNITGYYTNITNNEQAKRRDPYARGKVKCLLMGTGPLEMNWAFNLNDPKGAYHVTSILGKMDGRALNPLTRPLSLLEVKSASLQKMYLKLDADEYTASGNIDFYYNDVKVRVLKRDDQKDRLKKMRFVSSIANLALRDDNPRKNGTFRKGPINVIRDPHESFFGFFWRASLDGLTSAVMGTDQEKDQPRNIITKLAKSIAGPKDGQEYRSSSNDRRRMKKSKK